MTKTNNRPSAMAAKVQLREQAIEWVQPASVLDVYCGMGEMHKAVWHRAARYIGNDKDLHWPPRFTRFCSDAIRLLRAIDLQPYNVFDVDAWGSPWTAAIVIADRRRWREGEKGALVVTSGAAGKTQFGFMGNDMAELLGRTTTKTAKKRLAHDDLHRQCLKRWCVRAGVKMVDMWEAISKAGPQQMHYSAITFVGSKLDP